MFVFLFMRNTAYALRISDWISDECSSDLAASLDRIGVRARALVKALRERRVGQGGLDAFLHEYELSSREGVVLMCLAEALLRIPDAETANLLIKDKLGDADWERHLGTSESLFVNASTRALMLPGPVIRSEERRVGNEGVSTCRTWWAR